MARHLVALRRLVIGLGAASVALVAALAAGSSPAAAHASPVTFDPANGAELADAPDQVSVTFNEPPELGVSSLQIVNAAGDVQEVGELTTLPDNPRSLAVSVGDLPEGSYTAGWKVVSQVDGHPTSGAFSFGIGTAAAAADGTVAVEIPPLSLLETAGRLTLFTGLVPLVGVASVVPFAFGALVRRAHRRLAAGAGVVAVVGLVLLALAQIDAAGAGLGRFFGTSVGQAVIWRAIGLVVMAVGLVVALRTDGRMQRGALIVTGLAAAGTVAAHVATGHAAATATPAVEIASQWVHVIAIGVWIGGLAVLLAGLRGLSRQDRGVAARRFSFLAAIALGVVVVTGAVRTWSELDRVGDLWGSGWGRGVLAKILGVVVLAGLGAINRYRHVPIATRSTLGLRRLGQGELMLSVVVLGAAAVVASTAPPNPATNGADLEPITAEGADATTSVRGELMVDPGGVGTNRLTLRVGDFDTGEPVEGADVGLRFVFPDDPTGVPETELDLEETDPGTYTGEGTNLSVAGIWEVTAVVQTDIDSVEVPFERLEISDAPAATVNGTGADGDEAAADQPGALTVNVDDPAVAAVEDDGVTKYEIDVSNEGSQEGDRIQVWFEPERGGPTDLNVAIIDGKGQELPVSDPFDVGLTQTVDGDVASGETIVSPVTRSSGGSGFATVDLSSGEWQLGIETVTAPLNPEERRPIVGRLEFTVE